MDTWHARARGRRTAMFAIALLLHGGFLVMMSNAGMKNERVDDGPIVETMTLPSPPLRATSAADAAPPPARPTRSRPVPRAPAAPRSPVPPALEGQPIARAASSPEPPASAASAPLNLTLSRNQIRALIAQGKPTLAQLAPHTAKASPFDALAGDDNVDGMTLIELPHGVTEVHLHGECYRLIPTPRAQSDPFNHANERLTGPCIGNF